MLKLRVAPLVLANRVRHGTADDLPAVAHLLDRDRDHDRGSSIDPHTLAGLVDHGHLLVLEHGCDLGAAAHVVIDHAHGALDLLVVDPALHGLGIEDRMTGVAEALCEAYGCASMDVRPGSR